MQVNLAFGWLWILLGFASGALMGLRFVDEDWLGGYASLRRRLFRLGHISFFGLGIINLFFSFTIDAVGRPNPRVADFASAAFVLGGVLMPVCCVILALRPSVRPALLFAPPVSCLLAGGAFTFISVLKV